MDQEGTMQRLSCMHAPDTRSRPQPRELCHVLGLAIRIKAVPLGIYCGLWHVRSCPAVNWTDRIGTTASYRVDHSPGA